MSERSGMAMAQGAGLDPAECKTWHVAWAAWRAENRAKDGLIQRGYDVLVPTMHVTVRHAGRKMLVERPIFPRYLFVGVEDEQSIYPIMSTIAVNGLVMNHDKPVKMPVWIMRNLLAAQVAGAFDKTPKVVTYKEGQEVRFVGGPMENFVGHILKAPEGKRVEVLISMFGKATKLKVPLDIVRAA